MDILTNLTNPKCKFCGAEMTFFSYSGSFAEARYKFKCPVCHAELAQVQEYAYSKSSPFEEGGAYGVKLARVETNQYEEWEDG